MKYFLSNLSLLLTLVFLLLFIAVVASFISEKAAIYSVYIFAPLFAITLIISMFKGAFKSFD